MLCEECKRPRRATKGEMALMGSKARSKAPTVYDAVGCEACRGTGVGGREVVYQLLGTAGMRSKRDGTVDWPSGTKKETVREKARALVREGRCAPNACVDSRR